MWKTWGAALTQTCKRWATKQIRDQVCHHQKVRRICVLGHIPNKHSSCVTEKTTTIEVQWPPGTFAYIQNIAFIAGKTSNHGIFLTTEKLPWHFNM